ncbi:unnamed protein product [Owenia fusiformis]|nr:unnamed protein product [Owenia fusiformis]
MEVGKFKLELEADNAGITEMLEKRSLELDKPPKDLNNHRPEKRKYSSVLSNHNHVESNMKRVQSEKVLTSLAHDAARETLSSIHKSHSNTSSPSGTMFNSSSNSSSAITYNLGHVGAGSNAAIAAAASQAIAATQQMQQGRRTSSLKASFEFTKANASDLARDLTFGAGFSSSPSTPTPSLLEGRTQRTKKQTARALAAAESKASHSTTPATSAPSTTPQVAPPTTPASATASPALADLAEGQLLTEDTSNSGDWQYDPNEPRYCICNQVSYGDMVGCDNDDCTIEWFHYPCVGLTQAPKGKWYCPQCTAAMKRRGRK